MVNRTKTSLDKAKAWINELKRQADQNIVIALAGNKCDLGGRRVIPTEEGQTYAEDLGLFFIETSAKTGKNVQELFAGIARRLPLDQAQTHKRPVSTIGRVDLNARHAEDDSECAC